MRPFPAMIAGSLLAASSLFAQNGDLQVPHSIEAGSSFSIQSAGNGKGTLYIVGPNQVLERDIQLGQPVFFAQGSVYNAGRYLVIVRSENSTHQSTLDVTPANNPAEVSFLARPSRLPIGLHDGITGAIYVFDVYNNLITVPMPATFELIGPSGAKQTQSVVTRNGSAFTAMDSTPRQGTDRLTARVGDVASTRIVTQVPGDPCGIKMSAKPSGQQILLQTEPLLDCSGNAVPDGTIVTFTETYPGAQATVDVPLKRGIAQVDMPAHNGALLSAASGVVLGNQIRWEKQ